MPDPYNRPTNMPGAHCRACRADLSCLPPIARYCYHCGAALPDLRRNCRWSPSRSSWSRWLLNLWYACDSDAGNADAFFAGRSAVLLAYGKSMFNLGWRYEHAVGSRRNLAEAARCYWKAARLGDPSAVGRLGQPAVTDSLAPTSPPTLPPA